MQQKYVLQAVLCKTKLSSDFKGKKFIYIKWDICLHMIFMECDKILCVTCHDINNAT